ncbi:MAG: carbohydrate binding family 9 domain-containing protein, partial [Gemmatimonadota bacterium]|nr:carbohydrate binding family 9 domain-containing protein [Gemmatimonadota bacterium]
ELRVVYDDKYLYVLGRMYDPAPDSIVSLLSRRDVRTSSEQLKLVIDSYHDRRTAYQFITNPAGVKRDFYVYNDNTEDPTWDGVWDVATAIDSLGWVAEFRIPFSQLRFNNSSNLTFGFMAVRDIARTAARNSWPLFHRDRQGYVSQAGDLGGIGGLSTPRRLELTPYVVTKNETLPKGSHFTHPQALSGGADVKYGLSSNLTLDATINPDFGQVEADPSVLNLSAFEQFFEERRPFFLEGAGIFNFRTQCGDIDTGCTGLFYSRRIGRSPQLLGVYGNETSPSNTTILGASKIAGRLGKGLSVGFLDAVTQREQGAGGATIEPMTNYAVGRVQQSLSGGSADLGAMITATNRSLDANSTPYLRSAAYTGGVDFRQRFFDKKYELTAYAAGSVVRGSSAAISATQRDGVHRFQRPDDAIAFDSSRTSLAGTAQRLTISKFGGGITRFQSVYQRFSPGFETNDVGFQSRADQQLFRNWFSLQFNEPTKVFRRAFINFNSYQTWTTAGLPTALSLNNNSHIQFPNFWWGHAGINYGGFRPTFNDRVARGGPAVRQSRDHGAWAGVELDNRKTWVPNLFAGVNGGDAGNSSGWWVNPGIDFRVSSRYSASLGANFEKNNNDSQWRKNFGAAGNDTTHYTFARLQQTTLSMTTRMNFTATPTLSMQFYAQPFVTTGDYSNWRELANARADSYSARFKPYTASGDPGGFNFKQLRSNTVVRWEYRPGSTIFLVWSQGREFSDGRPAEFNFSHDLGDLFKLHPANTFLIKASYWFNP